MPKKLATEEFIERAKKVPEHQGKNYDYSLVKYVNNHTKVKIVCSKHGKFDQRPMDHLNGRGCSKCRYAYLKANKKWSRTSSNTSIFIRNAASIHGHFDYSRVNYVNNRIKVCILCSVHGEFWQKPNAHLTGHGCPRCFTLSRGEIKIANFLDNHKIIYRAQVRPIGCKHKKPLSFDFGLYDKDHALIGLIEYQGSQHYKMSERFGGVKEFKEIQKRDRIKKKYCKDKSIPFLTIPYTEFCNVEVILDEFIKPLNTVCN